MNIKLMTRQDHRNTVVLEAEVADVVAPDLIMWRARVFKRTGAARVFRRMGASGEAVQEYVEVEVYNLLV